MVAFGEQKLACGFRCLPVILISILAVKGLKAAIYGLLQFSDTLTASLIPVSFFLLLIFSLRSKEQSSSSLRFMARGLALLIGCHLVFAWIPRMPPDLPDAGWVYPMLVLGRTVALIAVGLSFWRSCFLFVVSLYLFISKPLLKDLLLIPSITKIDYMLLVDLGFVLVMGCAVRWMLLFIRIRFSGQVRFPIPPGGRSVYGATLINTCLGLYFSNYFFAGIKKLHLGREMPLDWLLNNHTALIISVAQFGGWMPWGHFPDICESAFEAFRRMSIPMNAFVLLAQIGSLAFLINRRMTLIGLATYISFHTGIYLASGILFSFWILLALLFILVLRRADIRHSFDANLGVRILSLVAGPVCIYLIPLGWFDTQAVNFHYFEAEDSRGRRYKAPTNYFLYGATAIAKGRFGTLGSKMFPTQAFGTTTSRNLRDQLKEIPEFPDRDEMGSVIGAKSYLVRYIRRHHEVILANLDRNGLVNYDVFAHHHLSNPLMFRGFQGLDKRSIIAYHYVVDAVWFSHSSVLEAKVLRRAEVRIPLKDPTPMVGGFRVKISSP